MHRRLTCAIATCCVALIVSHLPLVAAQPASPWPRHVIDRSSRGADGVRLADVNGDGRFDLATGWEEGGTVRSLSASRPIIRTANVALRHRRSGGLPGGCSAGRSRSRWPLDVLSCCEGSTRRRSSFIGHPSGSRICCMPAMEHPATSEPAVVSVVDVACVLPVQNPPGVDLVVGSKGYRSRHLAIETRFDQPRGAGSLDVPVLPTRRLDDVVDHGRSRSGSGPGSALQRPQGSAPGRVLAGKPRPGGARSVGKLAGTPDRCSGPRGHVSDARRFRCRSPAGHRRDDPGGAGRLFSPQRK